MTASVRKIGLDFHRDAFSMVAPPLDDTATDAAFVGFARMGHFFNTPAMTMLQLKAVTAALAKSFSPPPRGKHIVDIGTGDLILPVMDGPWKGQYLSWRPELGVQKHLRYPEPRGSHFILGRESGCLCWWTLKDQ